MSQEKCGVEPTRGVRPASSRHIGTPAAGYVGKLPGDIVIRRPGFMFAFPIVTCLLLSVVLTLFLRLFRR